MITINFGDKGSRISSEKNNTKCTSHKVIAVQLPTHSVSDDVETVKRAVAHIGGPTILVGHSYGGEVITNAGYNNPNVTGLFTLPPLLQMRVNR